MGAVPPAPRAQTLRLKALRQAALCTLALACVATPLHAQDRYSARLAGLNVNLAGVLPDPLTDPWRNPARWSKTATLYALFRAAEDRDEDLLESGATFSLGRTGAVAGRFASGPGEEAGERAYVGSSSVGFGGSGGGRGWSSGGSAGTRGAATGFRFDVVHDPERAESWGYAAAAGFMTSTALASFEVWGEYQRPRTESGMDGVAAEVVLSSPEDSTAHERLEPVILLRGGRHRGDAFAILARGPVTWYEASLSLRRVWANAGVFAIAVRRGEWKARTRCPDPSQLCGAIVDPTVGHHAVTAIDAALEFPFLATTRLRAGGTWPLDGSRAEYEARWPVELRAVGALRPGAAEGLFFGAAWKLASRLEVDAHGYPLFLDDDGASRRVGRYAVQVSVKL